MKSQLLGFAQIALSVFIQGTFVNGDSNAWVFWNHFTGCGGVVPISWAYHTVIDYKREQTYNSNEFCVWTLLPQETVTSISVSIWYHANITDPNDGIVAYFWNETGFFSEKLPQKTFTDVKFSTSLAFLAFSSDTSPNEDNGFDIHIDPTGNPGPTKKRSFHFNKDEAEFTYPGGGEDMYGNDEEGSVVVQGQDTGAIAMKEMRLKDVDTEHGHDFVDVYTLLPYHFNPPNYIFKGRYTGKPGNEARDSTTRFQFPNLYLFRSDSKIPGKGFTVQWKNFKNVEL